MDLLRAMALGIRQELRYIRRVERGVQKPVATLRHGSGTCRDFAWLMIDGVRALGPVSYTHLDVYKRQGLVGRSRSRTFAAPEGIV